MWLGCWTRRRRAARARQAVRPRRTARRTRRSAQGGRTGDRRRYRWRSRPGRAGQSPASRPPRPARGRSTRPWRPAGIRWAWVRCRCRPSSLARRRSGRIRRLRRGTATRRPTGRPPSWCAAVRPPPRSFLVVVPVIVTVVIAGGAGRQLGPPRSQVVGGDQSRAAHQPFQRPQPAFVVVPALAGRVGGFPVTDLADQRLTEVLPVDAPGVVQRQRDAERLALPWRGEHEFAVVPGRGGRAGRIEQVGGVGVIPRALRVTHGAATVATPTMASRVTRAASSASE